MDFKEECFFFCRNGQTFAGKITESKSIFFANHADKACDICVTSSTTRHSPFFSRIAHSSE
jgi:hypothetical protein